MDENTKKKLLELRDKIVDLANRMPYWGVENHERYLLVLDMWTLLDGVLNPELDKKEES